MPLRSAYPDERPGEIIRPGLRDAFVKLIHLEEFVSIRDELYLSTMLPADYEIEAPVWSLWPRLRNLALYNHDIDSDATKFFNRVPNLQNVVLTRSDGMHETDFHIVYMSSSLQSSTRIVLVEAWRDRLRPVAWVEGGSMDLSRFNDGLRGRFRPRGRVLGMRLSAPIEAVLLTRSDTTKEDDDIGRCQEWVKCSALNGGLWN